MMLRSLPRAASRLTSRVHAQQPSRVSISFTAANNKQVRAPTATQASTGSNVPAVVERAKGMVLTRTSGAKEPVEEVVQGKTVLGLLRHLGWPLCWEQAANLLSMKPQFDAAGYKLVVVSIGSPDGGKEFCQKLPFPEELLWLDNYDRPFYKALSLKEGFFSFFSPEAATAWQGKDLNKLRDTVKGYTMITPGSIDSTTQQGGLYVFDGPKVVYAYQDPGVGAHAKNEDILKACCAGAPA